MTSLLDLYRGAAITPSTAKAVGAQDASSQIQTAVVTRRRLLTQAIQSGSVQASSLGPNDASLLGLSQGPQLSGWVKNQFNGVGNPAHGVGGFFQNLGTDFTNLGKEFVPGLVEAGKAVVHDVGQHPVSLLTGPLAPIVAGVMDKNSKQGAFQRVVKPSVQGIATDATNIAGAVTGNRTDAEALYKHPLNPLLDLATVASGGAGAAARVGGVLRATGEAGRVADFGKILQSVTDRTRGYGMSEEVRPGTRVANDVLPRMYSARPLTKAFQVATDKYVQSDLPGAAPIRNMQDLLAMSKDQRLDYSKMQHEKASAIANAIAPMAKAFKGISPDESLALHLSLQGVNTDTRLAAFQDYMHRSLGGLNEEGQNIKDFPHVDERRVQHLANLPDQVKEMAKHPTEKMVQAAEAHAADIAHGHELLDPRVAENHDEVIHHAQNFIDQHADMLGLKPDQPSPDALPLNYVPNMEDRTQLHEPGRIARAAGREAKFIQPPSARRLNVPSITTKTMLAEAPPSFMHARSGDTLLAGAARTDARVFLDHAAQRESYIVETAYKHRIVNRYAYKTADGEPVKAMTMSDLPAGIDPSKVTIIHPTFPIRWFKSETNVLKKVTSAIEQLKKEGVAPDSPEGERYLEELSEQDAKAFIVHNWGALKQPGVVVDKDFADYQYKLATVNDPFQNRAARGMMKYINTWRKYTLSLMPRWAINTAAGTFLQAMVHGAIDPREWMMARTLTKEARDGLESGKGSFYTDEDGVARGLPPGVQLGHGSQGNVAMELGPERPGILQKNLGVEFPVTAHKIAGWVQGIEDHFRTGMYVHSLRKEDRQSMSEMGETLSTFYRKGLSLQEHVREALSTPKNLDRALQDTNKFAYNYTHLGPTERRVVRAAVPFWGWYKFITQLMWRLPAEYPGRTRVMNFLSAAGLEQQDSLGPVPDWLRGSIILNLHGGHLNYLSGQGLNPFSQFANPIDEGHGAVTALGSLGQLNPVLQSGLSAIGMNTLTGNSVAISPQDNVATELFGKLVNSRGEAISPGAVGGPERFAAGLMNAFPQFQLLNKYGLQPLQGNPGGSTYPDSIPFFHNRPMPTGVRTSLTGLPATVVGETGLNPKDYDLSKYQAATESQAAAYLKTHQRQLNKLLQKTSTR